MLGAEDGDILLKVGIDKMSRLTTNAEMGKLVAFLIRNSTVISSHPIIPIIDGASKPSSAEANWRDASRHEGVLAVDGNPASRKPANEYIEIIHNPSDFVRQISVKELVRVVEPCKNLLKVLEVDGRRKNAPPCKSRNKGKDRKSNESDCTLHLCATLLRDAGFEQGSASLLLITKLIILYKEGDSRRTEPFGSPLIVIRRRERRSQLLSNQPLLGGLFFVLIVVDLHNNGFFVFAAEQQGASVTVKSKQVGNLISLIAQWRPTIPAFHLITPLYRKRCLKNIDDFTIRANKSTQVPSCIYRKQ